jgi:hypothetical protein
VSSSCGEEYAIGEIGGEGLARNLPENAIPIAASRESRFEITHELDSLGSGDRTLVLVPTAPVREGKDTLAAAAQRYYASAPGVGQN